MILFFIFLFIDTKHLFSIKEKNIDNNNDPNIVISKYIFYFIYDEKYYKGI